MRLRRLRDDDETGIFSAGLCMKAATALVLGENILPVIPSVVVRERFSSYLVTWGSVPVLYDDFGEATITLSGRVLVMQAFTRYRPHTIQQSGTATNRQPQITLRI